MKTWLLLGLVAWVGAITVPALPSSVRSRRHRRKIMARRVPALRTPRQRQELDMGMVLTEVATRLRSGANIEKAWAQTLAHAGISQIARRPAGLLLGIRRDAPAPRVGSRAVDNHAMNNYAVNVLDQYGVPRAIRALWEMPRIARWRAGVTPVAAAAIPSTIAVCRMGYVTGAPLAEILDSCALGITEAGEAHSAREVAMAGPQFSAHMLAVLPLIGIALGYAMGADPFGFLFGSLWGKAVLVAGIGCELAGMWLVHRLTRKAVQEADVQ